MMDQQQEQKKVEGLKIEPHPDADGMTPLEMLLSVL